VHDLQYTAATGAFSSAWLLIAIPAVSALILLLAGRRGDRWGHLLGVAAPLASFVLGAISFFALLGKSGDHREVHQHLFSWVPVAGFRVDAGLLFDPLSACFVLLITGVGSLIHIYSIGYMADDEGRRRFFGYFNLFVASMLLLVLADNYLALYVGWEGVGLASYLLIGFWYTRPTAATAAKKAFIVNRVGDVGLSIAIMLMFVQLGTVSFQGVFNNAHSLGSGTLVALTLLLLLGACGKSGQFPLQTWLPDAMEGPTPVSALIHAATMVTAGVYLIARSNPLFDLTHTGRTFVCAVGAITLMIGCIVGCAKDDIKRVLAYSTVSQIGYMFLAVGLGGQAYAFGILHLLTHGFFKAALFLSAGSVMHGMNDQVDIRRFGALRKYMPVTWAVFGVGYLAIIGFPGLSGFFSKDKIIEAAFNRPGWTGWLFGGVALLGAGLTAFYMTRLYLLTFHGEKRWTDDVHPHESPRVMTWPMILLAIGSAGAGAYLLYGAKLTDFLAPVVGDAKPEERLASGAVTGLTLILMLVGIGVAWALFARGPQPTTEPRARSPFVIAARNNLYADAFNEAVLMRPGIWLTRALVYLDGKGIDGLVNGLAAGVGGGSGRLRRLQTGFVRSYALTMLGGSLAVLAALLIVRIS
jgi:NADH-quinone oxidoreductase subunit L